MNLGINTLGVSNDFKRNGIGKIIIGYLKNLFIDNNRTGCRYITVDAYSKSLPFYEKCGFQYLTDNDKNGDTRLMYYDLMPLSI